LHQQAVNSAGIVKGDRAEITGKREDNYGSKARAANRLLEPPAIGPRRWPGTWDNGDCHRSYRRSADARTAGTRGRAHLMPPCGILPDRRGSPLLGREPLAVPFQELVVTASDHLGHFGLRSDHGLGLS